MRRQNSYFWLFLAFLSCGCDTGSTRRNAVFAKARENLGGAAKNYGIEAAYKVRDPDLKAAGVLGGTGGAVLEAEGGESYRRYKEMLDDARNFNRIGHGYLVNGQLDEALAYFTRAIRLDPDYADAYQNRACVNADLGDFDLSIDDCTRAIALNPRFAEAYAMRSVANFYAGNRQQIYLDFNTFIQIDPSMRKLWLRTMSKYNRYNY